MFRNLKILGLALAALCAISGLAASAASAQQGELTSKQIEGATLVGSETGESNSLKAFGLVVKCVGSTYTGHQYNATPHALIPNAATTFTVTPDYKQEAHNCKTTPGNFATTIDMNGCDYVAHLGETTGGVSGTYGVTFDVVCPEGKEVAVTIWTNTTDETSKPNEPFCILRVKAQTGLKGAHATDTGNGFIDIQGTVTGIHVDKKNGVADTHTLLCPNATTSVAELAVDLTFEGKSEAGDPTSLSISE